MQVAGDWAAAGELLAREAQGLEAAGAECVVLCTNTMHKVADAIEAAVDIPLLHLADVTAAAVRAAGLDRVALLGTRFTMEQPFYADRLRSARRRRPGAGGRRPRARPRRDLRRAGARRGPRRVAGGVRRRGAAPGRAGRRGSGPRLHRDRAADRPGRRRRAGLRHDARCTRGPPWTSRSADPDHHVEPLVEPLELGGIAEHRRPARAAAGSRRRPSPASGARVRSPTARPSAPGTRRPGRSRTPARGSTRRARRPSQAGPVEVSTQSTTPLIAPSCHSRLRWPKSRCRKVGSYAGAGDGEQLEGAASTSRGGSSTPAPPTSPATPRTGRSGTARRAGRSGSLASRSAIAPRWASVTSTRGEPGSRDIRCAATPVAAPSASRPRLAGAGTGGVGQGQLGLALAGGQLGAVGAPRLVGHQPQHRLRARLVAEREHRRGHPALERVGRHHGAPEDGAGPGERVVVHAGEASGGQPCAGQREW